MSNIEHAARIIRAGGVVAFPTETVYGLGANALDARAVARVFELKARPQFDPLIVHVADSSQLEHLAEALPAAANELVRRFWPGPLTVVVPKRELVPDIVTAGLPSVAVRQPNHPLALGLLRAAAVPIAAPSANRFGGVSPTTAAHVAEEFRDQVDMILDGGPCRVGIESTIVSFVEDRPTLLRPGAVAAEEIERIVGPLAIPAVGAVLPQAPGMLPRHYAPRTPLVLCSEGVPIGPERRLGLLSLTVPADCHGFAAIEILSESGDLREAAANLFAALRRLDAHGLDLIVARPVPEQGLGRAIMDRLRRAAAPASHNPA